METTRDAMLWALDCLKRHELKLLKSKLGDCTIKDGTAIPAGLMERADNNKLVDLLIDRCTKRKAPVVLIGALQRCSKNELAEQLNEKLEKSEYSVSYWPECLKFPLQRGGAGMLSSYWWWADLHAHSGKKLNVLETLHGQRLTRKTILT
uniref:Pyrin domain-containing protein n=1 Tax=Erpetoichthys calabaricus TaxID=27687 RepID=A0A8C4TJK5_ERPCA